MSDYNDFFISSDESNEAYVINKLRERGLTFSCAESCTGGLFSGKMVSVPGASEVYNMGFVTYANHAKMKLLGVKEDTLNNYGAVSAQCATEMAQGAAKAAKADVAISITGIAGPGGGTKIKPVGTVYIGCYCMGETVVEHMVFSGDRTQVRLQSVDSAILLMKNCLMKLQ